VNMQQPKKKGGRTRAASPRLRHRIAVTDT
jgi:hypothetical protein